MAMMIGNYRLEEQLHESSRSRVHRGRRGDGSEVIVKTPAPGVAVDEFAKRLRHELLVCQMFDSPHLIKAEELVEEGGIGLVFESVLGAETLSRRARARELSVHESLTIALGIVDALATLHARNIVHKDIKPDNVLVNEDLSRVVLIDLGVAAIIPRDLAMARPNTKLEGTLQFMPPEQTGRVNRAIDHRSDYYALGATLHWMLTGASPFAALHDPNQLVHAQIAQVPPLVNELDPTLPPVLGRIVAKLLSKAAEERYQGSFGLRADLRHCLDELDRLEDFEIARVDPAEQLRVQHLLYGRERQLATLKRSFGEANRAEEPRLLVLCGPAGSGKTTLAQEFQRSLDPEVIYGHGKFEQVDHSEPYVAVSEALLTILARLMDAEDTRLQLLERVRGAVGQNAALLFELFPELEGLLGAQAEVKAVGPGEARDRFWDTLERFIGALLMPGHSYLLFVDDLQWADEPSLRVLESLCLGARRRLLVLVSFRDEVAVHGEAIQHLLERVRERGRAGEPLQLAPLSAADISALVQDALQDAPGSGELASLLHRRTHGTPLFVAQLLNALYVEGIVDIDRQTGCWRVDLQRAERRESTGDVVEFLESRFAALPEQARRVLGIAACVGRSFDLATLASVAEVPVAEAIWSAAGEGYLRSVSQGQGSGSAHDGTSTAGSSVTYRFAHDRLQQVAASTVPRPRAALHLAIARGLSQHAGVGEHGELSARIVEHIGHAIELIHAPAERALFGEICRVTGARAKAAAAFVAAANSYGLALRLIDTGEPAPAEQSRRRLLATILDHAECLYMSGEIEAGAKGFARARELVDGRGELIELLFNHARLFMVRGDTEGVLGITMEAAGLYELDLRHGGSQEWVGAMMGALLGRLHGLGPEDIAARPLLEDREQLFLIKLLQFSTYAAYGITDFSLFSALLITVIDLSLDHGITDTTGICFVQFSLLLIEGPGGYEAARRQADAGLAILEHFPDSLVNAETQMIYRATLHVWVEPLAASLAPLRVAYQEMRAAGMMTPAAYAIDGRLIHAFFIGAPLTQVIEEGREAKAYTIDISDRTNEMQVSGFLAAAEALSQEQEEVEARELLPTGTTSMDEALAGITMIATFIIHATRAFTQLLLGFVDELEVSLSAAAPFAPAATGQLMKAVFDVTEVIHGCDRYASASAEERAEHEARLATLTEMLGRWEASCPANARPFARLVEGAWAEAQGEVEGAIKAFTAAADAAEDCNFPNFEGFAIERAAKLLAAQGNRRAAIGYLEEAGLTYGRWGAKVLQLRVSTKLLALGRSSARSKLTTSSSLESETHDTLDVSSILEMSRAMFEATGLEDVIERLLSAANQYAGANRCVLLLDDEHTLRIRADRRASGELFLLDRGVALDGAGQLLALSVVRACARTYKPVVVDDAARDPSCASDPYIVEGGVRALLVVPVVKRHQRVGLLYLENVHTPGAFTLSHVRLLTTLAAQAAISIDNARLFDALREREAQWRAVVADAPDFIVIVDVRRRIEFVNRISYGMDPDEVIGQPIGTLSVPRSRAHSRAAVEYVFETGKTTSFESSVDTPEGIRHFTTRLGPITRDEVVERVIMIASDVTEQRRLQEHLRQSQKMEAIGTLAGGVAHDFNNLLTVITGACQLAQLNVEDQDTSELLAEIDAAAGQASSLTRQLLAFSRKQVLQPQRFDLNELVRELAKMLERLIGEQIELELELAQAPCPVFADRGQLSQVLVNLAVNARDAMAKGGTLTVTTALSSRADRKEVTLGVRDTGRGMDDELRERIFEPFFTTKDEGEGTGLGLATVLGIVEQSGGSIVVDSALGRGSSFEVTLPVSEGEGAGAGEREGALPPGVEMILLVEDELAVQRITARMLRAQGYTVRVAANGEQALALTHELEHLDLLITDVVMPGASGREVAHLVRSVRPEAKVLYASGYTDDAVMRHGVLDGSTAFIHKPFTRESLARAVRAVLDTDPE